MPLPAISGLKLRHESDSFSASDGQIVASWSDQSGHGFDTALTAVQYRAARFLGQPGLKFDGVTSYGDLGAPAGLEIYDAFTLFAVIRTSHPPTSGEVVVGKDRDTGGARGYLLGLNEPGSKYYVEAHGSAIVRGAGPALTDDLGHVQALTFDGATYRAYLDGVLIDSQPSAPSTPNPAARWNIGRRDTAGYPGYFNGHIGAVLVYDSALSGADRSAVETYLTDKYVGPRPPPPHYPDKAWISTSGELLVLKYLSSNGVTEAKVTAASGTGTLTIDGTPLVVDTWAWGGHGWVVGALCGTKYAKIIDDGDPEFVASGGTWKRADLYVDGESFTVNRTVVGEHFVKSAAAGAKATLTYIGCTPGPHRLSHMLWDRMDYDRSEDCVHTVKDGAGTVLGTFYVDLKYTGSNAMWPRFDSIHRAYNWTTIGDFILPAGQDTIVVEVTNGGSPGSTLAVDGLLLRNILVPPAEAGAAVTLDMGAGVVATAEGAMPAIVGRAVTFATDNEMMPYDAARLKTLKPGYNKEGYGPGSIALTAADLGPFTSGWVAVGDGSSLTLDDTFHGEMVALTGHARRFITGLLSDGVDHRMVPTVLDGRSYRIEFDWPVANGPFDATAKAGQSFDHHQDARIVKDAIGPLSDGYEPLGGTRWRLRFTYHAPPWRPTSARTQEFQMLNYGTVGFIVDRIITRFSYFDPVTPEDWTLFTHPATVARYKGKGIAAFRLMDMTATNSSTVANWGDYYPADANGRDAIAYRYEQPILAVYPVDRSDADLDDARKWFTNEPFNGVIKIKVASTAGLVQGHGLDVRLEDVSYPCNKEVTDLYPGARLSLAAPTIVVLDGQHVLGTVGMAPGGGGPGPAPNTIAPNPDTTDGGWPVPAGHVLYAQRPGQHPEIGTRVCADCEVPGWHCIPHLASDQYVRDWAAMAMSYHPPGTTVYVEYSNERWNFGRQIQYQNLWMTQMNWRHSQDPVANPLTFTDGQQFGAWRSDQLHKIALAEFAAAGRAADLYWILGTQTGNAMVSQVQLGWGATQTPPVVFGFQALAGETYQNFGSCIDAPIGTTAASLDAFYDRLSQQGQIDMATQTVLEGGRATITQAHRDVLDRNGYTSVALVSYEGGEDHLAPLGTVDVERARAQEISRDPRMHRFRRAHLEMLDRLDFKVWLRYAADYGGGLYEEVWCDFPYPFGGLGTGGPGENAHPHDLDGAQFGTPLLSQMGGGLFAWAAAMIPAPTPSPTPMPTPTPDPTRPMTVHFTPAAGAGDHVVTIKDMATGSPVPGLDRKSAGPPPADSLDFRVGPGTYTAAVEAVGLAPDPSAPTYSAPAVSVPFTVADANPVPPPPTGVTVTPAGRPAG